MRYQPKEVLLSLDELTALCAQWQETLRLQDWMVSLSIARARDMDGPKAAQVRYTIKTKTAAISILDPVDYPPSESFPHDMEQALVHELLHLHFAMFWSEIEDYEVSAEQAVDLIACGLVAIKRGRTAQE